MGLKMKTMFLRYTTLILSLVLLVTTGGIFAAWTYADGPIDDVSTNVSIEIQEFVYPLFTVTYMVGNAEYAKDKHYDASKDYVVKGAPNGDANFKHWVNAKGEPVPATISKDNTNDYILYAVWKNKYLIKFIDEDGALIYSEEFKEGDTSLSPDGQAVVNAWLANENAVEGVNDITVTWTPYTLAGANGDIIVRPVYTYSGYLNMKPSYNAAGVVDSYTIVAVDTLPKDVVIPGSIGGVPVTAVERITNESGSWNNYEKNVKTITIEENIKRLENNSLAYTPNLATVYLPNSLEYMGKNTFSRNFGEDLKKLEIVFNGTMEEWRTIVKNSDEINDGDWCGGLKTGTVVICSDGYFELTSTNYGVTVGNYKWKEYPN